MLNLDNETKDVLKEWGGLPSVHATKEDILIDQKRFFDEVEPTTEFSIEDVRRMPIWAAGIWNEYYALLVNINGETDYDEWGEYPQGMRFLLINKKDGGIRIGPPCYANTYIDSMKISPLDKVPFDNLKIG